MKTDYSYISRHALRFELSFQLPHCACERVDSPARRKPRVESDTTTSRGKHDMYELRTPSTPRRACRFAPGVGRVGHGDGSGGSARLDARRPRRGALPGRAERTGDVQPLEPPPRRSRVRSRWRFALRRTATPPLLGARARVEARRVHRRALRASLAPSLARMATATEANASSRRHRKRRTRRRRDETKRKPPSAARF